MESVLGEWASDAQKLNELQVAFADGKPYPHVIIDNFFAPDIEQRIESTFPTP